MPTREELRVWREYIETAERLRQLMAAHMQAESDLSPADYQVLLSLAEADGRRMRSSALATQCGWERSRLSHHLKRMEARGLIERESSPDDLRGNEIAMTSRGAHALRNGSVPHFRAIGDLFVQALTPEQLAAADDLTQALRRHLDGDGA